MTGTDGLGRGGLGLETQHEYRPADPEHRIGFTIPVATVALRDKTRTALAAGLEPEPAPVRIRGADSVE